LLLAAKNGQLLTRQPQGFDVFDLCFDFGEVTHFVVVPFVCWLKLRTEPVKDGVQIDVELK
jgi:hypothetical protein